MLTKKDKQNNVLGCGNVLICKTGSLRKSLTNYGHAVWCRLHIVIDDDRQTTCIIIEKLLVHKWRWAKFDGLGRVELSVHLQPLTVWLRSQEVWALKYNITSVVIQCNYRYTTMCLPSSQVFVVALYMKTLSNGSICVPLTSFPAATISSLARRKDIPIK